MTKKSNILVALIAALALGGAGYYIYTSSAPAQNGEPVQTNLPAPQADSTAVAQPPVATSTTETGATGSQEPDPPMDQQANPTVTTTSTTTSTTTVTVSGAVVAVNYQNNAFSPQIVEIRVGDTITFTNNSSASIRIASNPHPGHTSYPALDSGTLATGASYSIVFPEAVTVNYHNHLNPSAGGVIAVK